MRPGVVTPLPAGWHTISACWKPCIVQKKTKCNITVFQLYQFCNVGRSLPGNKVFAFGMSMDCEPESHPWAGGRHVRPTALLSDSPGTKPCCPSRMVLQATATDSAPVKCFIQQKLDYLSRLLLILEMIVSDTMHAYLRQNIAHFLRNGLIFFFLMPKLYYKHAAAIVNITQHTLLHKLVFRTW